MMDVPDQTPANKAPESNDRSPNYISYSHAIKFNGAYMGPTLKYKSEKKSL